MALQVVYVHLVAVHTIGTKCKKNAINDLYLSEKIKSRLLDLWDKNKNHYDLNFFPLFPDKVKRNCLLFLSLNPSLSDKKNVSITYPMLNSSKSFENNDPKPHQHFKKFFEIQNEIKENWTFLDLLYIRNSSQPAIVQLYKEKPEFIISQVKVTIEIINEIKPKLVVVANRFVETILLQEYEQTKFKMENTIYCLEGIPFIMRESGFMGSWRHWKNNKELKEIMYTEIKRVLKIIDN